MIGFIIQNMGILGLSIGKIDDLPIICFDHI